MSMNNPDRQTDRPFLHKNELKSIGGEKKSLFKFCIGHAELVSASIRRSFAGISASLCHCEKNAKLNALSLRGGALAPTWQSIQQAFTSILVALERFPRFGFAFARNDNSWFTSIIPAKRLAMTLSSSRRGFSMMGGMISLLLVGISLAATIPVMTKMSQLRTGTDKNTITCIESNSSSGWYTEATGETATPASGTVCYAAVLDARHNRGRAVETATWYADKGNASQKILAKKILRASCDLGGEKSCDYFINTCWKNGNTVAPYCDDTTSFLDITYYLHKNAETNENLGATYIADQVESLLPKWMPGLVNEVVHACGNAQQPDNGQNLNDNFSCDLSGPWLYIEGCNRGSTAACEEAYDNNYNKSCSQIKAAWTAAPTDNYKLTFKGADDTVTVSCNMYSAASAAITGCNAMTGNFAYNCATTDAGTDDCSNDCFIGHNTNYNRSCAQVAAAWPLVETGLYNLTTGGAPPVAPASTACTGADPNCTDTVGAMCPDGTVYAGSYNGNDLFVKTTDEGGGSTFSWNDGSSSWQTRYAGFPALPTSIASGKYNQYIINKWNESGNGTYFTGRIADASYKAAKACQDLNDANYLGYTDWFLPAREELNALYTRKVALTTNAPFASAIYWSSTENVNNYAWYQNFSDGGQTYGSKNYTYRVRCLRNNLIISPPSIVLSTRQEGDCTGPPATAPAVAIGTKCTDAEHLNQIYVGAFDTPVRYLFTTEDDSSSGIAWNDGSSNWLVTGAVDNNRGEINHNALKGLLTPSPAPYRAVQVCEALNTSAHLGKTDWYLPSKNELNIFNTNKTTIGYFSAAYYWSSTEYSSYDAWFQNFSDGGQNLTNKHNTYRVRCLRDDSIIPACTSAPGSTCADGTKFAGDYLGHNYFATPADLTGTYTWNNGSANWTVTGAVNANEGEPNVSILLGLADAGAPYYAAVACQGLNNTTTYSPSGYLGHNDWFLPARSELNLLYVNKTTIGGFAAASYWSSTEYVSYNAWYQNFSNGVQYDNGKGNTYRVRCLRKD